MNETFTSPYYESIPVVQKIQKTITTAYSKQKPLEKISIRLGCLHYVIKCNTWVNMRQQSNSPL